MEIEFERTQSDKYFERTNNLNYVLFDKFSVELLYMGLHTDKISVYFDKYIDKIGEFSVKTIYVLMFNCEVIDFSKCKINNEYMLINVSKFSEIKIGNEFYLEKLRIVPSLEIAPNFVSILETLNRENCNEIIFEVGNYNGEISEEIVEIIERKNFKRLRIGRLEWVDGKKLNQ